jgi:putative hydrolase of the HAD superfamily
VGAATREVRPVRAVVFDFGGVILTSPFEAFSRFEQDNGLPEGFLRQLNATNPDDNAWARLERNQVDLVGFAELYEQEARAAGHTVDAPSVIGLLAGELRPQMVAALRRCHAHPELKTALLTNNPPPDPALPPLMVATSSPRSSSGALDGREHQPTGPATLAEVLGLFDVVVESSQVGIRKPDPAIYRLVCEKLDVEPEEAVFLDDLGVNLKPARAMGMTTIKVVDPDDALTELEDVVGFPLR